MNVVHSEIRKPHARAPNTLLQLSHALGVTLDSAKQLDRTLSEWTIHYPLGHLAHRHCGWGCTADKVLPVHLMPVHSPFGVIVHQRDCGHIAPLRSR